MTNPAAPGGGSTAPGPHGQTASTPGQAAAGPPAQPGPGSIGDALDPLVHALTSASTSATAESAGDAKVMAVVQLGWLMRELAAGWPLKPTPVGFRLDQIQSCQAQAHQLANLLSQLRLPALGPDAAEVQALTAALQTGVATQPAATLHSKLIVALLGADARYSRAYALGDGLRALVPTAQAPAGQPRPDPVVLVAALDALSSQLPGHAARSVATSLCRWATSSAEQEPATIELQVVLWRAVLIGEKRGTELLEPEDYLKAARELEKRFTQRALSSKWLWVVAALAAGLFVAGLVILVASHGHAGRVAAGASGVLAALGLTWKGIGGTIGKLVAKLEAPLWGAELDAAITDVITLSSTPHVTSQGKHAGLAYADRRGRARAATQPPAAPASQSSAGRPA